MYKNSFFKNIHTDKISYSFPEVGCNDVHMDKIRTFAAHCSRERRAYAILLHFSFGCQ